MVNIFTDNNNRKLIIFSHKEYLQGLPFPKWSLKHKLVRLDQVILHYIRHFYVRKVFHLTRQSNGLIGVHWGYLVRHQISGHLADFHLTDTTQGNYIDGNIVNGFQSRDFITTDTQDRDGFDFITVSHNSKRKRLDEIVDAFISLQKSGLKFRALIIVNTPSKKFQRNTRTTSVEFLTRYNSLSDDIKQDIVLMRLSPELGNFGIGQAFILQMMRMSKFFILNSAGEGNAKVITEALTSGCKIIGRTDLQGNTFEVVPREDLYITNNLLNTLAEILHKQQDVNKGECSKISTIPKKLVQFCAFLSSDFDFKFDANDPQFSNLDKKLPTLYRDGYPWIKQMSLSNVYDLKSIRHWRLFNKFNKER